MTKVRRLRAENVTGPVAYHAESPVWSESWGGLRYVDLTAGRLLTLRGDHVDVLNIYNRIAAFVRPRVRGGYIVATERGVALADAADEQPQTSRDLWSDPTVRMNDGTVDPQGRLLAGTMAYDGRPGAGRVYRINHDLSWHIELASVTVSNGIAFSPDATLMYYTDTATGRVDVFDVDDGVLSARRPFVQIDPEFGMPDGLTVADDGSVWIALWGGSAVNGYTPTGHLDDVVELPARQVSACTFGGATLDTLYITTSRQGLDKQDEIEAGSVFRASVGHSGLPVMEFAG